MKEQWKKNEADFKLLVNVEENQHGIEIPIAAMSKKRRDGCCEKSLIYSVVLLSTVTLAGFLLGFCCYAKNYEYLQNSRYLNDYDRVRDNVEIKKDPDSIDASSTSKTNDLMIKPFYNAFGEKIGYFMHDPSDPNVDLKSAESKKASENFENILSKTNKDNLADTINRGFGEPNSAGPENDIISEEETTDAAEVIDKDGEKSDEEEVEVESKDSSIENFKLEDQFKTLLEIKLQLNNLYKDDSQTSDPIIEFLNGKLDEILSEQVDQVKEPEKDEKTDYIDLEDSTTESTNEENTDNLDEVGDENLDESSYENLFSTSSIEPEVDTDSKVGDENLYKSSHEKLFSESSIAPKVDADSKVGDENLDETSNENLFSEFPMELKEHDTDSSSAYKTENEF